MENAKPIDCLKQEYKRQYQHLQKMQALYNDKYVSSKRQHIRAARQLKMEIYQQQGVIMGIEVTLNILDPIPF